MSPALDIYKPADFWYETLGRLPGAIARDLSITAAALIRALE